MLRKNLFQLKFHVKVIFIMAMSNENEEHEGGIAVQEGRPKLKEPPRFAVLLHNDDYTTMEFVIEILRKYFHRTEEQAVQIMLQVHQQGKGVAGIYHHEIAETKVVQVHEYARSNGFPLKCSVEPAP
jgi:ATP-dependent Clp protease adaptor protein ClpS